jgi:hypothetical protein
MEGWQAILDEVYRAIRSTVTLVGPYHDDLEAVIANCIRSTLLDLKNVVGSFAPSETLGADWEKLLRALEKRLAYVLDGKDLALALREDEACSRLEDLARSLASEIDKSRNGDAGSTKLWQDACKKIQSWSDHFCISEGHATESEILNVAECPSLAGLAALKRYLRREIPEATRDFRPKAERVFASARVKFHLESLSALPPEKQRFRIKHLLELVDPTYFGSIGLVHPGFLQEAHAVAFLDEVNPRYWAIGDALLLIAYVAGKNACVRLLLLLNEPATCYVRRACVDALRIIGGVDVTATFCGLLGDPELQKVVAGHLVDMACVDVRIGDEWWTDGYDPNRALISSGPLRVGNNGSNHKVAENVLEMACKLKSDNKIPTELADGLLVAIRQYLEHL